MMMQHSGYQCANMNGNTCVQVAETEPEKPVVVQTGVCSGTDLVDIQTARFPDDITVTVIQTDKDYAAIETKTVRRQIALMAPMIQVNYQPSDLLPTETLFESSTGGGSSTSIPGVSETETIEDQATDSGLSGDKIGAIVGGTLGGLLVCAAAAWIFWRLRKRRRLPELENHATLVDFYRLKNQQGTAQMTTPVEMDVDYTRNGPLELHAGEPRRALD